MNENLLKHYNHPFYEKVDQITDEVKLMQIRKGAEKYPEPFTPSSWTGKELAIHALQELRDGQVYVVGMLERIEELEKRNNELVKGIEFNNKEYGKVIDENNRYIQALEFYAYEGSYEMWDSDLDLPGHIHDVDHDSGDRARQALEGKSCK